MVGGEGRDGRREGERRGSLYDKTRRREDRGEGSPPQHTWRIFLVELLQKTQCLNRTRPQVDVNTK